MKAKAHRDIILWFFLALLIASTIMLGWLFLPFLPVIILAYVVSGIFNPVYRKITVKDKITPPFASLFTCLIIFIVLFIPIVVFVGILSKEAQELLGLVKNFVASGQLKQLLANSLVFEKLKSLLLIFNIQLTGEDLNKAIAEIGQNLGLYLFNQAQKIAANMLTFIVYFFFMLLVTFYFLLDGNKIISFITDLSPLPKEQDEKLILKFKDMTGAILIGNGVCGIIQGIAGGIIFMLFGLQSAFLWGVIMGVLAFLPVIGIGIVFIPTALLLFLKGRTLAGFFFIVFYVILSGGVEYLLKPKLVGERVKMHTLLVFLSIIGGLQLFGILGIIYGPLIVTGFLTLTDIYRTRYQRIVEHDEIIEDTLT